MSSKSVSGASCRGVVDGGNTWGTAGLWKKGAVENGIVSSAGGQLMGLVSFWSLTQKSFLWGSWWWLFCSVTMSRDTQGHPEMPRDIHCSASCPSPPLGRAELSLGVRTRDQNPGTPRFLGNLEGDIVSYMINHGWVTAERG